MLADLSTALQASKQQQQQQQQQQLRSNEMLTCSKPLSKLHESNCRVPVALVSLALQFEARSAQPGAGTSLGPTKTDFRRGVCRDTHCFERSDAVSTHSRMAEAQKARDTRA